MKFKPPKAAAYSSCLPTGLPRTLRAMWKARSASPYLEIGRSCYVASVFKTPTHTLAVDPRPVPTAISDARKRSTERSCPSS